MSNIWNKAAYKVLTKFHNILRNKDHY